MVSAAPEVAGCIGRRRCALALLVAAALANVGVSTIKDVDPAPVKHTDAAPAAIPLAGCIHIPASLNELIDRYGVLDLDYLEKTDDGRRLWVLRSDRTPTPWPGRYLAVVDSMSDERPPTGRLNRQRVRGVEHRV